jgi:hypothetical protein
MLMVANQHSRSQTVGAPAATRFGVICSFRDGMIGRFEIYQDPDAARHSLGLDRWPWDEHTVDVEPFDSPDARALRAYARLGLALHPCLSAAGAPQGVAMPAGVRPGTPEDLPLTEAVDRAVRGAAHGGDIAAMLEAGSTLLVAPGRGYSVVKQGQVRLVAALDEEAAVSVLRAALAHAADAGDAAFVEWLTADQQWAIGVCVEARLELRSNSGAVFLGGDVGPFRPYLPSGAYL